VPLSAVAEHKVEHDPRIQGQEGEGDAQDEEKRVVRWVGHVRPAGYHDNLTKQITSVKLQLHSKSQVSNSKHSERRSFEFGQYVAFVMCHLNFPSSVPDIEKCQSDDDRERRNRNEEHDFKNAFFVFEVHEKPQHEARLGRSDQKIGEHAPFPHAHLGSLDGHTGEYEQRDPDENECLWSDDVLVVFGHRNTPTSL
jgi:hypothetical protein